MAQEIPLTTATGPASAAVAATGDPRQRRAVVTGAVAFVAIFAGGETYAKWWPYAHKVAAAIASHAVHGTSILSSAGAAGAAPGWHDAWSFADAYGLDIWIALVAGILIGAGVEVLVPRRALAKVFDEKRAWRASLAGGLLALPCLMCTCCGSPITVSLRRADAPVAGALSYWLGNPLLNPVVLVLLALALPWPYVVVRVVVGAVIVFGAAPLVSRLFPSPGSVAANASIIPGPHHVGPVAGRPISGDATAERPSLRRYLRAVVRLAAWLLPEYFAVVLLLGAFRGWLLPLGHSAASWGFGAVVVVAVGGTILVIPTAAELPLILGLLAIGLPSDVTGALVIALPALSLASSAMVGRWLSWRVTAAAALVVVVCSIGAGALVGAL